MQCYKKVLIYALLAIGLLAAPLTAAALSRIAALNHIIECADKGIATFGLLAVRIENVHKTATAAGIHKADVEILSDIQSDIMRIISDKRNLIGSIERFYQKKVPNGKEWTIDMMRISGQVLMVLHELLEQDSRFKIAPSEDYKYLLNSLYGKSEQLRLLGEADPKELNPIERKRLQELIEKMKKEIGKMREVASAIGKYIK